MVFVESLVASLIALFVAQGFKDVSAKKEKENIVVSSGGKEIVAIPLTELEPIQQKPLDLAESFVDRVTSTDASKPTKPQLELKNPQDRDNILYNLSVVPNANFKIKGIAQIRINGRKLADIKEGALTDVDSFGIPLPDSGLKFFRDKKLELFVWSSDGSSVSLTMSALIGGHL